MFKSQKRKFVVPGLKRKAEDEEEASKPIAGSSAPVPLLHHNSGLLEHDKNSQTAKGPACLPEKENSCPDDVTAAFKSTQHLTSLPPSKKPFLAPKAGLSGGFKLPSLHKQPLQAQPSGSQVQEETSSADAEIFTVLYTKRDKFKKKSAKNYQDGVVELKPGGHATLYDVEGKLITKCKIKPPVLESGAVLELHSFMAEYDREIPIEEFKSGACFIAASNCAGPSTSSSLTKHLPNKGAWKPHTSTTGRSTAVPAPATAVLIDPNHPDAIVLNPGQWQNGSGKLKNSQAVMPVVIDPYIGRHLRPHQAEGIMFMYDCVTGLQAEGQFGCILADEMGLGKTLQVIGLIWTLVRQGPMNAPLVRKAIVVAPATLVKNWGKEVSKWLGSERLKVMVLSQGAAAAEQVKDFKQGTVWKLLVGSYETLRKYAHELEGCCDLLVCDEGHRLKASGGNKTITALLQLGCQRRVILTGTPVQNNMEEFYALLSFVVPGVLGTMGTFKRVYGDPITAGRDKDCTQEQKELGAARAQELQRKVAAFVLRRTQEILAKHLPALGVYTVFCRPTQQQVKVYDAVIRSPGVSSIIYAVGSSSSGESVLPAITVLRKLCNHPNLLRQADKELGVEGLQGVAAAAVAALLEQLRGFEGDPVVLSAKLSSLTTMLEVIAAEGSRTVVVSTSTAALDLIEQLVCIPKGYKTVRIDGGTSVEERQAVVDNFNNLGIGQVFLLSTRAGGAGLNLVGANHLVLYDSDWNPAMDKQAMARIWRDGQKKSCFVYRMLTTGTIEEKVYQRQLMKSDLAAATIEVGQGSNQLSHYELKQLFHLETAEGASTQRLVPGKAASGVGGGGSRESSSSGSATGGSSRSHISWKDLSKPEQLPKALAAAVAAGGISAINQEDHAGSAPAEAPTAAAAGREVPTAEQEASHGSGSVGSEGVGGSGADPGDDDVMCLEVD